MPEPLKIIQTADGSATIYLEALDETYHSTHGALAESLHVYIENGLKRLGVQQRINILEVGFGTGLNALLSMDHLSPHQQVHYYALEPFPLDTPTLHRYYEGFAARPSSLGELGHLLQTPYNTLYQVRPDFSFCLLNKPLQELQSGDVKGMQFDLIYYDAFGPSKQADMWTLETLSRATGMMAPGAVLCTYCAQGQFKRHLKALGLTVENPPGALGKRQMTVARKF